MPSTTPRGASHWSPRPTSVSSSPSSGPPTRSARLSGGGAADFGSAWRNAAASIRWDGQTVGGWTAATELWGSRYRGDMIVGLDQAARPTSDAVDLLGVRAEAARRGERTGARIGADVAAGRVDLVGTNDPDSYIQGESRARYVQPALYAEVERWIDSIRVAPGLRASYASQGHRWLLEPRLAARAQLSDALVLTVGAGRVHQLLSTVRDDRYLLPGPPLWLAVPDGAPLATADGVDAALDGWLGRSWSYDVGAYGRLLRGVPRWRPSGSRELTQLAFDHGTASGVELMMRRHGTAWSGWVGYGLSRVVLREEESGRSYAPPWDRRHSVDAALFWRPEGRLSASARATYGSGTPFWPVVGEVWTARITTFRTGGPMYREENTVPVWSDEQLRLPDYFRLDLALRTRFHFGRAEISPYASVLNATARLNALGYDLRSGSASNPGSQTWMMVPVDSFFAGFLPSLGLDVRF